ncbi:MAG: hypothetical protein NVSMB67_12070 [Flavisolibacter sp.]
MDTPFLTETLRIPDFVESVMDWPLYILTALLYSTAKNDWLSIFTWASKKKDNQYMKNQNGGLFHIILNFCAQVLIKPLR